MRAPVAFGMLALAVVVLGASIAFSLRMTPPDDVAEMTREQWERIEEGATLEDVLEIAPKPGKRLENPPFVHLHYRTDKRLYQLVFENGLLREKLVSEP